MSSRPTFIAPIRTPPEGFDEFNPVSSWRALVTRNNLQYWIDLCAQHRINWVAPTTPLAGFGQWPEGFWIDNHDDSDGADTGAPLVARYAIPFVHTWIRSDYPTGLDIVIAGLVGDEGGDDMLVEARIVPESSGYYDPGARVFWENSANTTGADTTCVIEDQAFFNEAIEQSGLFIEHTIDEEGEARRPRQALLRLEITVTVPEDDEGGILEVLVREFACQS